MNIVDENYIKALNIYKNIMAYNLNISKILEDSIIPNSLNRENNDLINQCKSAFKLLKTKRNKIKKLKKETIEYIEVIEDILNDINGQGKVVLYNIYKLNCLYYLYKLINSDINSENYIIAIDDEIVECINDSILNEGIV